MGNIRVLDSSIANKIAAGEVVERPASALKELVENSIDANATQIAIEVNDGGISYMRVADNGAGMSAEDAKCAFLRHATSKIHSEEDLAGISTLGFRGEALASIAAVSRVEMKTRRANDEYGTAIVIVGGETESVKECGCPDGTSIVIKDLFYNVPARRKFLKSARSEGNYISDFVLKLILSRPDISIKFTNNGHVIYHSNGDGSLKNAIYSVYGNEIVPYLRELAYDDGYTAVTGYVGAEHVSRTTRLYQSIFVNGRFVRSGVMSAAVSEVFDTRLMSGRYPFLVMSVALSCKEVDANVHPNKLEVKFADEERVLFAIRSAVRAALGTSSVPNVSLENDDAHLAGTYVLKDSGKRDNKSFYAATSDARPLRQGESPDRPAEVAPKKAEEPQERATPVTEREIPVFMAPATVRTKKEPVQTSLTCEPFEVLCCAFDAYWIVRQGDTLFIVDQHAAHERLLYENMMNSEIKTGSQTLLVPIIIKLTAGEYATYMDNKELFESIGFEISEFGNLTLRVCAVPHLLAQAQNETVLRDALELLAKNRYSSIKDVKREAIIRASCRSAVKSGDMISPEMMSSVLKEYETNGFSLTCPHGRPIMVAITHKELLKMFKRIV